jgi:hypothetical protein
MQGVPIACAMVLPPLANDTGTARPMLDDHASAIMRHVNPRHHGFFLKRRAILLSKIEVAQQKGLEIGALDLPYVTPDMGRVDFADQLSTDDLKALAARTPGHSPDFVQDVDFVLSQTPLDTLASDYDWVAASHVIEHVPDLIGWLVSIGDRLVPKGLFFCVAPDRRFTFDINRPVSTLGKIFQDHMDERKTPSFRDVFDAFYYSQTINSADAWAGKLTDDLHHHAGFHQAWTKALQGRSAYVDCHCNIFTSRSFAEIISTLATLHVIPFDVDEVSDTPQDGIDFHAILRKKEALGPFPSFLPEGFDPQRYVYLHPDLMAAGVDGAAHYLEYGFYEGRKWR